MSHIEEGRLHEYLDGELSGPAREQVDRHLAECADCRARLDAAERVLRRSSELLGPLETGPLSVAPWSQIEARGRERARERRPGRSRWLNPNLAWAASLALAFAVGWLARSSMRVPPEFALPPIALEPQEPAAVDRQEALPAARDQARAEPSTRESRAEMAAAPTGAVEEAARPTAQPAKQAPAAEAAPPGARETYAEAEGKPAQARGAARPRAPGELEAQLRARRLEDAPAEVSALRVVVEAGLANATQLFFESPPAAAETWLGAPLRTLPDLELEKVEVGPGDAVAGEISGRPLVRLVYRDAAGQVIELLQQREDGESAPSLVVTPAGVRSYRWSEGGYRLTLTGALSADSLRGLAERVR